MLDETPNTPNGTDGLNSELEASSALANLLQNVGKAYEGDKNLLEQSKKSDEAGDLDNPLTLGHSSELDVSHSTADLYRDGGETDDVWTDGSMGLQERITAAATRLANNHREDKTLRNDAMRAIGGNLSDLRKAMSLQRTFDMATVKRVADLARVLISGGYIGNATSGEVKRLLSAVRNSVGHDNIDKSIRNVLDIMVDNQLRAGEAALISWRASRAARWMPAA